MADRIADFGSAVEISDLGAGARVTVAGSGTIFLAGVSGDGSNVLDAADFVLA